MNDASVSYKAELVGVFGCPVAENPTIVMQEAAFEERGLNWRYLTIEVRPEDLEEAMMGLRAFNMQGVNLTIPHKVTVIQYLDRLSPEAELIGAVNTVVREGDQLVGHNTDGKGFLRSVRDDAGVDPAGKRIVFLGAGGAARAMSVELALAGAAHITIVNRTPGRGQALVRLLQDQRHFSPDAPDRFRRQVISIDPDLSPLRADKAHQDLQKSRLAGPGSALDHRFTAAVQGKGQPLDELPPGEGNRQIFHLDNGMV